MARTKQKVENGFVLFDVLYEDGTRTSNRKVPASEQMPRRGCLFKGMII
jgi:hypothetical protein